MAALGLLAAGLAGCNGKRATYVTRFPDWEYQDYERIAVVPARPAEPEAEAAAKELAEQLTTLLTDNGAFEVLSRSEMEAVFAEQDLSNLADAVNEGTALPAGKIEIAQALVVPRITDYRLIRDRQERSVPVYRRGPDGLPLRDPRTGRVLPPIGEERRVVFRYGAEVGGGVRVVDAATGRILVSHSTQLEPRIRTSEGRPPKSSAEELADEAVSELARDLYLAIAPTRLKVKLDKKMLILARDYFDGRYAELKKIARDMEGFLLVVRDLPEVAERNDFRVAIAEEEGRENLFEQAFTWSGATGPEGIAFRVPVEPLLESDATKFVAKLYCLDDPEPKVERGFELENANDAEQREREAEKRAEENEKRVREREKREAKQQQEED